MRPQRLDDCSIPSTSRTMSGEGIPHYRGKGMVHHLISKREQELKKKKNRAPGQSLVVGLLIKFE